MKHFSLVISQMSAEAAPAVRADVSGRSLHTSRDMLIKSRGWYLKVAMLKLVVKRTFLAHCFCCKKKTKTFYHALEISFYMDCCFCISQSKSC